jgi:CRP/FNR family transcriptional regulator, cyclic AMP receptor protein
MVRSSLTSRFRWRDPEEMIEVTVASLAAHPFLRGVRPDLLARLVPTAVAVRMPARQRVFEEGGYAAKFWLIRSGAVALGLDMPGHGLVVVATLGRGDVMGWSWLFPPYRWSFGAVTTEPVEAFEFDGRAARAAFDEDPCLGYEMTRRFVEVVAGRLQATRFRMLQTTGPVPQEP